MRTARVLMLIVPVACWAGDLVAQDVCASQGILSQYVQCKIDAALADDEAKASLKTQRSAQNESDHPSLSSASTGLLDRTSGPDIAGMALQLAGVGQGGGQSNAGATTVTASAYAVRTTFLGQNPLNPTNYCPGRDWRRVSFTLGREAASDATATEPKKTEAKVFGTKILLVDRRDVCSGTAITLLNKLMVKHDPATEAFTVINQAIIEVLFDDLKGEFPDAKNSTDLMLNHMNDANDTVAALKKLSKAGQDKIEAIVHAKIDAFRTEKQSIAATVEAIRKAPQLSISYTGKFRDRNADATQFDDHRLELIYDQGISKLTAFNLNASYDYHDSRRIGADLRGARIAGSWQAELNHDKALGNDATPMTFNLEGESSFLAGGTNIYRVQGRLSIPIAKGISLPISVTRSNRTELIKESEIRGQFGFTIDVSKLTGLFANSGK